MNGNTRAFVSDVPDYSFGVLFFRQRFVSPATRSQKEQPADTAQSPSYRSGQKEQIRLAREHTSWNYP